MFTCYKLIHLIPLKVICFLFLLVLNFSSYADDNNEINNVPLIKGPSGNFKIKFPPETDYDILSKFKKEKITVEEVIDSLAFKYRLDILVFMVNNDIISREQFTELIGKITSMRLNRGK